MKAVIVMGEGAKCIISRGHIYASQTICQRDHRRETVTQTS